MLKIVGFGRERCARSPFPGKGREGERTECGLVIGQIGQHTAGRGFDPVADRRAGVTYQRRRDAEFTDVYVTAWYFVKMKFARQLVKPYRE